MLKSLMRDAMLAVQSRSGITASFIVWLRRRVMAASTASAFLCVAAYDWLALQIGSVYAGLVMAAIFVVIAIIGLIVCLLARRRARERAILERAARAHAPSWLLDPKILATAVQVGRSLGWQRVIPLALVGYHGGAMGARTSRARARARRVVRCEAQSGPHSSPGKVHRSAMAGLPPQFRRRLSIQPAPPAAESDAGKLSV